MFVVLHSNTEFYQFDKILYLNAERLALGSGTRERNQSNSHFLNLQYTVFNSYKC